MSMTDPVADFLTRIRNALMRGQPEVRSPSSKLKVAIAEVLQSEGYIRGYQEEALPGNKKEVTLTLKYDAHGESVIRGLKRISRPGLRLHAKLDDLPHVYNGQGIAVVTTSLGVLSDYDCRQKRVSGEILCHVW